MFAFYADFYIAPRSFRAYQHRGALPVQQVIPTNAPAIHLVRGVLGFVVASLV
jgi:hypothetical protein